jgi:lysophospholipase L1-like esterase
MCAMKRLVSFAAALLVVFACAPRVRNLTSNGTNVIAFGDSLTAGYGAAKGEDWPSRVTAATGIPLLNAGMNGDTTESALARIDEVLEQNPRIVIVALGGNDFLRGMTVAATEANLREIVRRIQAHGAMVMLLGFRFPSFQADYEAMYERVADDGQCFLVEGTLKGILTDRKLKSDEIHPNAAGYALMAERIAGPLQKLVKRADAERSE